jgi:predicted ATPase
VQEQRCGWAALKKQFARYAYADSTRVVEKLRVTETEKCFRMAIENARRQNARSAELRATTSLARLLVKRGKRNEARSMLAEIYGWFTEGFDTADLKDAKALLHELRS